MSTVASTLAAGLATLFLSGCATVGKRQECAFLYDECCRNFRIDYCQTDHWHPEGTLFAKGQ
jgi:hypothetical protein